MCTGEWIDTTLAEAVYTYPQFKNYELVIWDSPDDDAELYYLGTVDEVYEIYKNCHISYTDEYDEQVQLEGDIFSLGIADVDYWGEL